jgi:hypothetical protein
LSSVPVGVQSRAEESRSRPPACTLSSVASMHLETTLSFLAHCAQCAQTTSKTQSNKPAESLSSLPLCSSLLISCCPPFGWRGPNCIRRSGRDFSFPSAILPLGHLVPSPSSSQRGNPRSPAVARQGATNCKVFLDVWLGSAESAVWSGPSVAGCLGGGPG